MVVPNCNWTGSECDLLVVTRNLRIIDVEIKVSVQDLRADAYKDKWYHQWDYRLDGPWHNTDERRNRPRDWPAKVWKHYYVLPAQIWRPTLLPGLPRYSGVLLLGDADIRCERRSTPCRDARPISAANAVDIARLASLRMWNAYQTLDDYIQKGKK